MKIRRVLMLVSLVTLLAASGALADIVYLNTGGRVIGKIIERTSNEIVVSSPNGLIVTIPVDDIEEIEEGSAEDIYKQQIGKIKADDADAHYKLGLWCKDVGLAKEAKKEFEKVIAIEPRYEEARWELGYQKAGGKWVSEDEMMKAKGFVKHEGRWVSKEDYEKIQKGHVRYNDEWVSKEDCENLKKGLRKVGDKWLTEEESYKSRGYVKHKGNWVTKEHLEKLKKAKKVAPKSDKKKEKKKIKRFSKGRGGQAGSHNVKIKVNGKEREYVLKVPGWAASGKAASLVVLLHGTNSRPQYMLMHWSPVAGRGAILAAPWALSGKWLVGEAESKDDPQFVLDMIEQIKKRYNIALQHIYIAGHSRGGFFTFTLGVQYGDLFAACGLLAGGYSGYVNPSERKAPFYIYIVERDPSVPVSSARKARDVLKENGHEVKYHEVPGGGGTAADHELTRACCQECWDFFKKHKLKSE
jgi:predicted esterase